MKVLVLGGSGFVGRAIVNQLVANKGFDVTVASRRPAASHGIQTVVVDATDLGAMKQALQGFDAIINCVAGDGKAISAGTKVLTEAARHAGQPLIVHFSTMSVYGGVQGVVKESSPLQADLGWYGQAKIEAEAAVKEYGRAVILRPGCIVGAGSDAWVFRPAYWLRRQQLGDLGELGDAPANLVDVDDVAHAAISALQLELRPGQVPCFNLAAPDSPRWNQYFIDLAVAIGATPVQRFGKRKLQQQVYLRGIVLKVAERLAGKLKLNPKRIPPAIPPSLMRLWSQHIRLDVTAATGDLGMVWTPYEQTLQRSAEWVRTTHSHGS